MNKSKAGKYWKFITEYYDIETGEFLMWTIEKPNYTIIKKTKSYADLTKPTSTLRTSYGCRKKPKQTSLFD